MEYYCALIARTDPEPSFLLLLAAPAPAKGSCSGDERSCLFSKPHLLKLLLSFIPFHCTYYTTSLGSLVAFRGRAQRQPKRWVPRMHHKNSWLPRSAYALMKPEGRNGLVAGGLSAGWGRRLPVYYRVSASYRWGWRWVRNCMHVWNLRTCTTGRSADALTLDYRVAQLTRLGHRLIRSP